MPVRSAVWSITMTASLMVSGCGGDWPPLPGVEERGRLDADTWEVLREKSPWKRPLASDLPYRRLAVIYKKMNDLNNRAQALGGKVGEEYSQIRFRLDQHYAGTRSLVFRLRSSGAENSDSGRALIETDLASLENEVLESVRSIETMASGMTRETSAP